MTFGGKAYSYGVTYSGAGNATSQTFSASGASVSWHIDTASLIATSGTATRLVIGINAARPVRSDWTNVILKFGAATNAVGLRGGLKWVGGSIAAAGSIPTYLFEGLGASDAALAIIEGVDLSALVSGSALVGIAGTSNSGDYLFLNCKLGSSVAILNGTIGAHGGPRIRLINCDSADTQYRFAQALYEGIETSETGVVRTGGATDGTTPVSRKIVTTAGASIHWPYESLPIEFWNETLGSITLTVPVLTDNITLTDAEAWLEVEYLGTSGFPLGVFVSDRVSDPIFGTPANQTTDGASTWASAPGTPVKQLLSVTFTPQEKGLIRARVMVARASTTIYYDPKIAPATGRQYQAAAGFINEGPSGYSRGRVVNG